MPSNPNPSHVSPAVGHPGGPSTTPPGHPAAGDRMSPDPTPPNVYPALPVGQNGGLSTTPPVDGAGSYSMDMVLYPSAAEAIRDTRQYLPHPSTFPMPYIGLGLNQAAGYQPPPPTSPVSTYSSASYHSFDGSGFPARNYQALPANYAYSGGPQSFQHYPSTGSFQTAASTFASDAGSVASSRRTSTQGSTSTQGTGNTQGSSTPQPASNVSGVTTPKPPRKGQAAKRRRTAADNGYHEQASTHAADTLNDTLEINRRLAELLEMTRNPDTTTASAVTRMSESMALLIQAQVQSNQLLQEFLTAPAAAPSTAPAVAPSTAPAAAPSTAPTPVDAPQSIATESMYVRHSPQFRNSGAVTLARYVRDYYRSKIKDAPLDPCIFATWEPSDGPCCDMEHFYVDVSKVPSAPWNACAAEVFITAFLDAHADEPVVTAIQPTRCDIMRLFTSNFRTGRRKAATEALSDEARSAILRDKRRRERKRWIYYCRIRAAQQFPETTRFAKLVELYGVDGMSTDASQHKNLNVGTPVFRISQKKWRNPRVTAVLRTLDSLHRETRYRHTWEATPGAQPHIRLTGPATSTRPAVPNLPRSLYCEEWLKSQSEFDIRSKICVQPTIELDLNLDSHIIELTRNNNGQLDTIMGYA